MSGKVLIRQNFILKGLGCSNCAAKIERAVNDLPYVMKAELNFATSKIFIELAEDQGDILSTVQEIADQIEPGISVIDADMISFEQEEKLLLEGLGCSGCAAKIEKAVNELAYVKEAELNFAISTITIQANKSELNQLLGDVQKICDRTEPGIKVKPVNSSKRVSDEEETERGFNWRLTIGAALFALAVILFETSLVNVDLPHWGELALFGISYWLVGGPVVMIALRNIRRGQIFDENFLMMIATVGAFAIGEYPEGVTVMLFYMVGEMFQERAVDRSRRSIKSLMDIRPDYANLKQEDQIKQVSPEMVNVGDLVVVKPGEKVPLDGKIIGGQSMMDTSALTGESVPRKVEVGDLILGGMINKDGLLTIEVTKRFGESTVSKILDLVENASGKKAPTEKFITKFARYYTPFVVYSALAMAVLPPLFMQGAVFSDWLYRALIFLVVSCPCALVVSIPLGFFGGIGRASREGILVKGGNYLEALNQVKTIVFDKTGTLTKGVFRVNKVNAVNGFTEDEILKFAALAESNSNHPIAKSILEAYQGDVDQDQIELYQEISGHGVRIKFAGQNILAGNHKLLEDAGIGFAPVDEEGTIVYIGVDDKYAGHIIISDEMKPDAAKAIQELKTLGVEQLVMLTGDREKVAKKVSEQLGLSGYYAELLPDQKVEKVEGLLDQVSQPGKVVFVGDGINDAPVLARSDIGVAMGGLGSDAAIEAADVVLMTDEPSKLITAIKVAKETRNVIWQNIVMALGIKGIVLLFGALGMATMWAAVFADVGVALLAVLNAMRIIRSK